MKRQWPWMRKSSRASSSSPSSASDATAMMANAMFWATILPLYNQDNWPYLDQLFTDLLQQFPPDWFHGWRALIARLDLMTAPEPSTPRKFRAAFTLDGKRVQFEVTASSARNPFRLPDLQAFQCPKQL